MEFDGEILFGTPIATEGVEKFFRLIGIKFDVGDDAQFGHYFLKRFHPIESNGGLSDFALGEKQAHIGMRMGEWIKGVNADVKHARGAFEFVADALAQSVQVGKELSLDEFFSLCLAEFLRELTPASGVILLGVAVDDEAGNFAVYEGCAEFHRHALSEIERAEIPTSGGGNGVHVLGECFFEGFGYSAGGVFAGKNQGKRHGGNWVRGQCRVRGFFFREKSTCFARRILYLKG